MEEWCGEGALPALHLPLGMAAASSPGKQGCCKNAIQESDLFIKLCHRTWADSVYTSLHYLTETTTFDSLCKHIRTVGTSLPHSQISLK